MSTGRRRFRILSEIAEGAFGKVFLAEQLTADGLSRVVAIKLLHARWNEDEEVLGRARDEARLLGKLHHEGVVHVEDLTFIDGKCAFVMEYLEGADLRRVWNHLRARREAFPLRTVLEIGVAVAGALHAAYTTIPLQGGEPLRAMHRDVKPSNVFVTLHGTVKLLDFGTARGGGAREAKTRPMAFGSAGYLAPERIVGKPDSPAGDVFALGVTLWELLTLETFGVLYPRPAKFPQRVEERLAELQIPGDPARLERIRALIRSMLAFEPSARPTAGQAAEALDMLAFAADDTDLRRFSRTVVAEVQAAPHAGPSTDPLIGQVLAEDDPSSLSARKSMAPIRLPRAHRAPAVVYVDRPPTDLPRLVIGVLLGALLVVSALGVVVGLVALTAYLGAHVS